MVPTRVTSAAIMLSTMLVLAACGGGGSDPAPPANQPPTANAGTDQSVEPGAAVTLAGAGSDADGTVASYAWSQRSGAAVTLSGADQASATFTAPALTTTSALVFRLTVTDDSGASASDDVTVEVAVNQAPTANAGADQTVQEGSVVTLVGAGNDADGTIQTFAWTQTAGPTVTLSGANQANASFTAPAANVAPLLQFSLVVTDDDGAASAADTVDVNVVDQIPATVVISGTLQYEFVNRGSTANNGLDFNNIALRPIRGATIQAIANATQQVLATATSAANGSYSLTVPTQTDMFVRVRAELKQAGTPGWDVEIRDNTSNTNQSLAARPIYALDGSVASSGVAPSTRNLTATTGWGGAAYTGPRAAAPFSILDAIRSAIDLVLSADAAAVFPPLDAFWSVNNCPTAGSIDTGDIGTSFYRPDIDSLFLLGCAGVDTEEFDTHVVAHEWGHYFEDVFSRSDSIGGSHSGSEQLDMRLAFGEGWGNAVSAMILANPRYRDTFGNAQASSFEINVETNPASNRGWYSEFSTQSLLYDWFDSAVDGADAVNLGFAPLYEVLTNEQRVTPAFTSIFSFSTALKAANPAAAANIDALLASQSINAAQVDIYGSAETNDAGGSPDALPVFTEVGIGSNVTVCSTRAFDPGNVGNKLGVHRYLRLSVPATRTYSFVVTKAAVPAVAETSDPDFRIYRSGALIRTAQSGVADSELLSLALDPGDYALELFEFQFSQGATAPLTASRVCFDVAVN